MRPTDAEPPKVLPTKFLVMAGLAVVVGVGGILGALHFATGPTNNTDTEIVGAAQDFARAKVSGNAHFAPLAETAVETLSDGRVKVSGTVDVVAPSGNSATYSYTVFMRPGMDPGTWIVDDVSLIPL